MDRLVCVPRNVQLIPASLWCVFAWLSLAVQLDVFNHNATVPHCALPFHALIVALHNLRSS